MKASGKLILVLILVFASGGSGMAADLEAAVIEISSVGQYWISINFNAASDAIRYVISTVVSPTMSPVAGFDYVQVSPPLTIFPLTPGETYRITIFSIYDSGNASDTKTQVTIPPTPAVNISIEDMSLVVTGDDSKGADGYIIKWGSQNTTVTDYPSITDKVNLDAGTEYTTSIAAYNSAGVSSFISQDIETAKVIPTGVTVSQLQATSFQVNCEAISGATEYTVTAKKLVQSSGSPSVVKSSESPSVVVDGLQPETGYSITVTAMYPLGVSNASDAINETTSSLDVNVTVTAVGQDFIQISFNDRGTGNSYRLRTTVSPDDQPVNAYDNVTVSSPFTLSLLSPGKNYSIEVSSVYDNNTISDSVNQVTVPADPVLTYIVNGLTITGSRAPADGVDKYFIKYRYQITADEWVSSDITLNNENLHDRLEDVVLNAGTEYIIQIAASNVAGRSGLVNVTFKTDKIIPNVDQVTNICKDSFDVSVDAIPGAIQYTASAIDVAFDQPARSATSDNNKLKVVGLKASTRYTLTVTATYPLGDSDASSAKIQSTLQAGMSCTDEEDGKGRALTLKGTMLSVNLLIAMALTLLFHNIG